MLSAIHAKGATCAFQFLTAAIVDNKREEIIDTMARLKRANATALLQSRKVIKQYR